MPGSRVMTTIGMQRGELGRCRYNADSKNSPILLCNFAWQDASNGWTTVRRTKRQKIASHESRISSVIHFVATFSLYGTILYHTQWFCTRNRSLKNRIQIKFIWELNRINSKHQHYIIINFRAAIPSKFWLLSVQTT